MEPLSRAKTNSVPASPLITGVIDELCARLASFGLNFRGYTSLSVSKYNRLPSPIQNQISEGLAFAGDLVNSAPEKMAYKALDSFLLAKACQALNLSVPDSFMNTIVSGDIVEVYDLVTQRQLYRNFEFLRSSSYDLLTVCVMPYPELFAREEGFEAKILARTTEIIERGHATEPWNVPNHHLVEKLESHQRKFFLRLGNIAPVYSTLTGDRVAWASTIQVANLGSSYQNVPNVVRL